MIFKKIPQNKFSDGKVGGLLEGGYSFFRVKSRGFVLFDSGVYSRDFFCFFCLVSGVFLSLLLKQKTGNQKEAAKKDFVPKRTRIRDAEHDLKCV